MCCISICTGDICSPSPDRSTGELGLGKEKTIVLCASIPNIICLQYTEYSMEHRVSLSLQNSFFLSPMLRGKKSVEDDEA